MSTAITRSGIEELRERIRRLEGAAGRRRLVLPFGIKAIDRHLPGGGLALGALHEVAGGGNGAIDGAAAALFAAGVAARTRGKVLWCITRPDLFAPALAQAGLVPDRVIYVEAGDEKSVLICFEEGLRHGGLGSDKRDSKGEDKISRGIIRLTPLAVSATTPGSNNVPLAAFGNSNV